VSPLDVYYRQIVWAGAVAFIAAFWTAFGACVLWVCS
jgi:hypothetical protein